MLSLLVFFPVLFGASLFLVPERFSKAWIVIGSGFYFLLSCSLFFLFDPLSHELQLVEKSNLIPFLGVKYFLGLDGLSFWYVILTAFLLPLVCLFSLDQKKNALYFFLLFLLVTLLQGAFLSFDGILFYIFYEMSLLPLFFIIFVWGGANRVFASFKFLIYTFFGSLFLLGGLLILMLMTRQANGIISASLLDFYNLNFLFIQNNPLSTQALLFFCFAFAFAIKTPLIPFHTWLPLAHVEAPTGASVFLAAIVLKLGTYGWFRFVLPLFPEATSFYSPLLLFLAVSGLLYASLVAFAQQDMKKLVAYSSIAHMTYVLIGLFAFNIYGLHGAFFQTLTHGISSAGLFFLVGIIYERTQTREISKFGGLSKRMPYLAIAFFLITLSSIALPLTGAFVSEFLVLLGSYLSGEIWVWLAALGLILSAIYMLNLFQKIFWHEESELVKNLQDLNQKEFFILIPLICLSFFMGIFPGFIFKYSSSSLNHLDKNKYNYSLTIKEESSYSSKNLFKKTNNSIKKNQQTNSLKDSLEKENSSNKTLKTEIKLNQTEAPISNPSKNINYTKSQEQEREPSEEHDELSP